MSNTVIFDVYDADLKKDLEAQGFEVYLNSEYVARTNEPITDWDFADMQDTVLVSLTKQTPQGLLRVELSSQGDRHLEMFAEGDEDGKRTTRFQNELLPSGIRALWEAFGSGTPFEMHDGTWCFDEVHNGWFELEFFVDGVQVPRGPEHALCTGDLVEDYDTPLPDAGPRRLGSFAGRRGESQKRLEYARGAKRLRS